MSAHPPAAESWRRTVPDAVLAGRFGVHPSTINAARAGKTWQHVEGGT